jgi:hypothetical protein
VAVVPKNKLGMNGWKTNDPKGWFFSGKQQNQKVGQIWYM